MKKISLLFVMLFSMSNCLFAQEMQEPDFIGDAFLVQEQTTVPLDKEYARFKKGISMKHNSWNAFSLYIDGKAANCRTKEGTVNIIVKAADNNSDPMSIIIIYKLKAKKSRTVTLSADNSDQLFHSSKTFTKDMMKFTGKRYGTSSYLLTTNLEAGEYAIMVKNPNNADEKSAVVSCIGIDK